MIHKYTNTCSLARIIRVFAVFSWMVIVASWRIYQRAMLGMGVAKVYERIHSLAAGVGVCVALPNLQYNVGYAGLHFLYAIFTPDAYSFTHGCRN